MDRNGSMNSQVVGVTNDWVSRANTEWRDVVPARGTEMSMTGCWMGVDL